MLKAIYKKRLLKAADIVENVKRNEFHMGTINGILRKMDCGTPACVWGHYLHKHPRLRKSLSLYTDTSKHFGISEEEASDMFSAFGCNNAKTGKQAAKYIRQFVKRKEAEL
jgi:hypothetical protein